ncbi:MAG: hypothetical protein ACREUZ_06385, partial [Burkholderiales bacterium]
MRLVVGVGIPASQAHPLRHAAFASEAHGQQNNRATEVPRGKWELADATEIGMENDRSSAVTVRYVNTRSCEQLLYHG